MDAASRKRPCAGGSSGSASGDRLSDLPDALLHTILAFLKTRQVVQTSVLSKRWIHLWRSVPCLNIDQGEFSEFDGREKFEDFVDNLLAHRNGSLLDTFQLHINRSFEEPVDATRWIRRGLKCSPKELCFYDYVYGVFVPMPRLDSNACSLRKLHLYSVGLFDSFSEQISSTCALLEVLELETCHLSLHEITLPALKKLIIKNCRIEFSEDAGAIDDELCIIAPRLSHLHVILKVGQETFSVSAMPSLIEATIILKDNYYERMLYNQWQVVSNLCNATSLQLSGLQTMAMQLTAPVGFPIFKNLRSLLLYDCDLNDNFKLLALFLQNAPDLEELTVHCCKFSKYSSLGVNLVDPQCTKLKSTEIKYEAGDNSCELVNLLMDVSDKLPKNTITLIRV